MSEPNAELREARLRLESPHAPGEVASRQDLAELVNAWIWDHLKIRVDLDANYIGKLERGLIRSPRDEVRAGLRAVLQVQTDGGIGLRRRRHSLSKRPAPSDPGMLLAESARRSTDILAFAESSNVGDLTIEQIQSDLRRLSTAYLSEPTLPLFTRTVELRDQIFTLLSGRQRPHQARDLYAAAGWALTMLAWMTIDMGRPDLYEGHGRAAWACADNADHNPLRAWVRATQHTAAYWSKDFLTAAHYATDGLLYATGSAAAFLASAGAVDYAHAGDADRARAMLLRARRETDHLDPRADELAGPFTCAEPRALGLWSDACLTLGQPQDALRFADDAIAGPNLTPGSERMVRLQVVRGRLALGRHDGAADALQPILELRPEYRVSPLVSRMMDVHSEAVAARPVAATIEADVRDFLHDTVRPSITGGS